MLFPLFIKATVDDLCTLQDLSRRTFSETFAHLNTAENMRKYLEENLSLHRLEAEMTNPFSVFYLAWIEREAVAYLKVNFPDPTADKSDSKSCELERIYVRSDFQGKNIGKSLLAKAIQIARELEATHLWLGVWEKNEKALAFYRNNGFVEYSSHIFQLGDDEQTDILMRLKIS